MKAVRIRPSERLRYLSGAPVAPLETCSEIGLYAPFGYSCPICNKLTILSARELVKDRGLDGEPEPILPVPTACAALFDQVAPGLGYELACPGCGYPARFVYSWHEFRGMGGPWGPLFRIILEIAPDPGETIELVSPTGDPDEGEARRAGLALINAAEVGESEAVEILLRGKVDLDAQDSRGVFPLMAAAGNHHWLEILKSLLGSRPRLDLKDNKGRTALHGAVLGGNPDGIRLLIAAGADRSARDHAGKAPPELIEGLTYCPDMLKEMILALEAIDKA